MRSQPWILSWSTRIWPPVRGAVVLSWGGALAVGSALGRGGLPALLNAVRAGSARRPGAGGANANVDCRTCWRARRAAARWNIASRSLEPKAQSTIPGHSATTRSSCGRSSVQARSRAISSRRPLGYAPGQRLKIEIDNRLEPCTDKQSAEHLCFNDTNFHTHGLWVSPSGNSDNVLISIAPGSEHQYEYDVPADHPAGTFWYHPHAHGAGFGQVGSGMAGALIVTGGPPAD